MEDVQGNLQQLCKTMASVKQKKTKKLVGALFCNGFWMKQMMMEIRKYVFFFVFCFVEFLGMMDEVKLMDQDAVRIGGFV